MPWAESSPVNERMKFVVAWSGSEDENFSALCRHFGISRRVGYKWLDRFEKGGPGALEDRRPVARQLRHRLPLETVDLMVRARKQHPSWGPKKLRARLLAQHPELKLPAVSTIGDILKRYGLVGVRKRRLRVPADPNPLDACAAPNDVWCVDFKGHFALGDGTRCHPLTITDACTRFLIKCEGLTGQTEDLVMEQFRLAFAEFGVPRKIRSDNGVPFASVGVGGLSRLSVWWMKLGITLERIEPGKPQQNGRHERMHRTLKDETTHPPEANMVEQQLRFDLFRAEYNNDRPHESLAMQPPARRYARSLRAFPNQLTTPALPDGCESRVLCHAGKISWKGKHLTIGVVLARETVGVRATTSTSATVHYGAVLLGELNLRSGKATFTRSNSGEISTKVKPTPTVSVTSLPVSESQPVVSETKEQVSDVGLPGMVSSSPSL